MSDRINGSTQKTKQELARELMQPLGPEYISYRPGHGNQQVPYLEGFQAIRLANEIFGHDGWNLEFKEHKHEIFAKRTPFCVVASCLSRVTLRDGTIREDIGYGTATGNDIPANLVKAGKEAATDALKRVLRTFGDALGNCLYDKNYMKQVKQIAKHPHEYDMDNIRRPDFLEERRNKRKLEAKSAVVSGSKCPVPAAQSTPIDPPQNGSGATNNEAEMVGDHDAPARSVHNRILPSSLDMNSRPTRPEPTPPRVAATATAAAAKMPQTHMAAPAAARKHTSAEPVLSQAESIPESEDLELPVPAHALTQPNAEPLVDPLTSSPPLSPDRNARSARSHDTEKPEDQYRPMPFVPTPGLVSGGAIEKFQKSNVWEENSFDSSISLGAQNLSVRQDVSRPVRGRPNRV